MASPNDTRSSPRRSGTSRRCVGIAMAAAVLWALTAAYHGYGSWPHMPMDVSAVDPATKRAFDAAVRQHAIAYAIIALLPLLVLLPLSSLLCRRRNPD